MKQHVFKVLVAVAIVLCAAIGVMLAKHHGLLV